MGSLGWILARSEKSRYVKCPRVAGAERAVAGHDQSEQLEYIPAQIRIRVKPPREARLRELPRHGGARAGPGADQRRAFDELRADAPVEVGDAHLDAKGGFEGLPLGPGAE